MNRYRDLKQRISRYTQRPQSPLTPDDDPLGAVLDAVNAWGFLEDWVHEELREVNCFGPGVYRGFLPTPWAGVCCGTSGAVTIITARSTWLACGPAAAQMTTQRWTSS